MADKAAPIGAACAAIVIYKVGFPSSLFSYHPTLLGLGWLAITPYAVHKLRESKTESTKEGKEAKVRTHALLNWVNFGLTVGGLYAIWKNKENMAAKKGEIAKHLVSRHGKSGFMSACLATAAMVVAIFKTQTSKGQPWRNKLHRALGASSYLVAGVSMAIMVNGPWGKRSLGENGQKAFLAAILACQGLVAAPAFGLA